MNKIFLLSCLLIAVLASSLRTASIPSKCRRQSIQQLMGNNRYTPSFLSMSTGNDNVNDFSSETPKTMSSESVDDDASIDFDKLTEESAAQAFLPKSDLSDLYVKEERKAPRQAQWFPMLLSPSALDGSLAGDVGFDPFGFAKDKEALFRMREAEIKHSRLAMLAAAGWPLSELWHREIADAFGLDSILAEEGRAPSVLNGGLDNTWVLATFGIVVAIGAALEFTTFKAAESNAKYRPGELGFDPLRLYSFRASFGLDKIAERLTREEKLARAKFDMELCEIKHGRLAMIAMVGYVGQEFIFKEPVVLQSPFFFGDPML